MRKYWLCLILVFAAVLTGATACKNKTPESPTVRVLPIILDGVSDYCIVRADDASKTVIDAAVSIWSAFSERHGISVSIYDAYAYHQNAEGKKKIVVGDVPKTESELLAKELLFDDYTVCMKENDLYLVGGSDGATAAAVDWFLSECMPKDESKSWSVREDFRYEMRATYPLSGLMLAGIPVQNYRIVYPDKSVWSQKLAVQVRNLIRQKCGLAPEIVSDRTSETECEILVGITNRQESREAADSLPERNVYYRIVQSGTRLVLLGGGVQSGNALYADLEARLNALSGDSCDPAQGGLDVTEDIRFSIDRKMQARTSGTELRVMHSNVLFESNAKNGMTPRERAELLADTYYCYLPDILTLNECFGGQPMDIALRDLLAEQYIFIDFTDKSSTDKNLQKGYCGTPIAYSKSAGLTLLSSGASTVMNGDAFHSAAWCVMETKTKNRFLVLSVHLPDNRRDGVWSNEYVKKVIEVIDGVRRTYGDLPCILNGDWFFYQASGVLPYEYLIGQGFADAGEVAGNQYSVGIGTYHTIGQGQAQTEEDLTFVSPEWFTVLSHKILRDYNTVNGSDHFPVLCDLRFSRSATADDIPSWGENPPEGGLVCGTEGEASELTVGFSDYFGKEGTS